MYVIPFKLIKVRKQNTCLLAWALYDQHTDTTYKKQNTIRSKYSYWVVTCSAPFKWRDAILQGSAWKWDKLSAFRSSLSVARYCLPKLSEKINIHRLLVRRNLVLRKVITFFMWEMFFFKLVKWIFSWKSFSRSSWLDNDGVLNFEVVLKAWQFKGKKVWECLQ